MGGASPPLARHLPGRTLSGGQRGGDRALQLHQSGDQQSHPDEDRRRRHRRGAVARRPGERLQVAKDEYVLLDKEDFEQVKLEVDEDHRHREVRAARRRSIASTGTFPIIWCGRQDRHRGVRRHPRGDEPEGHGGDRPAGDEHPRADLRHRDRGAGLLLTTLRTAEEVRDVSEIGHARAAQARSADARHRREDHRAAGRRLRSCRVHRPLRGCPARRDRAEEERPSGEALGQYAGNESPRSSISWRPCAQPRRVARASRGPPTATAVSGNRTRKPSKRSAA